MTLLYVNKPYATQHKILAKKRKNLKHSAAFFLSLQRVSGGGGRVNKLASFGSLFFFFF